MDVPAAARLRLADRFPRLDEGHGGRVGSGTSTHLSILPYLSIDQLTQELVAVKRQRPSTASAGNELAAYETLRAFPHPNALRMVERFCRADSLYLVVEHIKTTLWEIWTTPVGRRGLLDPESCAGYLSGLVAGVGHLHGLRVAHGDLSLANILVAASHCVKVSDLGTAHSAHGHFTTNRGTSTPYVRAPEAWAGCRECGLPGDRWAVGVAAMMLLSGECPWLEAQQKTEETVVRDSLVRLLGIVTDDNWPPLP